MVKFISLLMVPDNKPIYVNPEYIKAFWTSTKYFKVGRPGENEATEVTVLDIRDRDEIWVMQTPKEILNKLSDDDGLSKVGKLP